MLKKDQFDIVSVRIDQELENMKTKVEEKLQEYKLFPEIKTNNIKGIPLDDELISRAMGTYLGNYYNGAEKIFLLIARKIDGDIPSGTEWHKELLEQMMLNLPNKRPPVITSKTYELLIELRGFRHVFRNIYGADLNHNNLIDNLKSLSKLSESLNKDINFFLEQMEKLISLEESQA